MKLTLSFLAVLFVFIPLGQADTINLNAIADSFFFSENNANQGSNTILASEQSANNPGFHGSWMKFDIAALQGNGIISATLFLTTVSHHTGTGINHEILSSGDDSWLENTVSGLNQPVGPLNLVDVTLVDAVNGIYSWDITSAVTGAHGLGGSNTLLSLLLMPEDEDVIAAVGPHLVSREGGASQPLIVVETGVLVPEPGSLVLITIALGFLGYRRIR